MDVNVEHHTDKFSTNRTIIDKIKQAKADSFARNYSTLRIIFIKLSRTGITVYPNNLT